MTTNTTIKNTKAMKDLIKFTNKLSAHYTTMFASEQRDYGYVPKTTTDESFSDIRISLENFKGTDGWSEDDISGTASAILDISMYELNHEPLTLNTSGTKTEIFSERNTDVEKILSLMSTAIKWTGQKKDRFNELTDWTDLDYVVFRDCYANRITGLFELIQSESSDPLVKDFQLLSSQEALTDLLDMTDLDTIPTHHYWFEAFKEDILDLIDLMVQEDSDREADYGSKEYMADEDMSEVYGDE